MPASDGMSYYCIISSEMKDNLKSQCLRCRWSKLKSRLLPIMGPSQWMSAVELRLRGHRVEAAVTKCYEATTGVIADPDVVSKARNLSSMSQR